MSRYAQTARALASITMPDLPSLDEADHCSITFLSRTGRVTVYLGSAAERRHILRDQMMLTIIEHFEICTGKLHTLLDIPVHERDYDTKVQIAAQEHARDHMLKGFKRGVTRLRNEYRRSRMWTVAKVRVPKVTPMFARPAPMPMRRARNVRTSRRTHVGGSAASKPASTADPEESESDNPRALRSSAGGVA